MAENTELILLDVRVVYPRLYQAKPVMKSGPKFTAVILLHKKDDAAKIKQVQDAIAEVKKNNPGKTVSREKICLKDGADKERYGDDYLYINVARRLEDGAPRVVDGLKQDVPENRAQIFSGCFCNFVLGLWWWTNEGVHGISCNMEVVQYVRSGPEFKRAAINIDDKLPTLSGETVDPLA